MCKPRTRSGAGARPELEGSDMAKRTCSIDGCETVHRARGWCNKHWERWSKHGDPLAGRTFDGVPLAHYYATVDTMTDDCILWPYGLNGTGYAQVMLDGEHVTLHALACEQFHDPRPAGMEVLHSCRNRDCYNPRHLRWGTRQENSADTLRDGTRARGEMIHQSKLTREQVLEIRTSYAAGGVLQRELGDEYGVAQQTIGRIVRRTEWVWLN